NDLFAPCIRCGRLRILSMSLDEPCGYGDGRCVFAGLMEDPESRPPGQGSPSERRSLSLLLPMAHYIERASRLFVAAVSRNTPDFSPRSGHAVELAERFAEGRASRLELGDAWLAVTASLRTSLTEPGLWSGSLARILLDSEIPEGQMIQAVFGAS